MGGISGTGIMARLATPPKPSHVYRPTYTNYGAAQGLDATPQAAMFTPQMPAFSRPQMAPLPPSGGFGRFPMQAIMSSQPAYRIPYGPSIPQKGLRVDPNLAAINQAFASPERSLFTDQDYTPPSVYMDETQRNAILKNPGAYLEYAQYVQGGGDPSKFARQPQPIQYMTQGQRDALTKSQGSQLESILPPSAPSDSGGGD